MQPSSLQRQEQMKKNIDKPFVLQIIRVKDSCIVYILADTCEGWEGSSCIQYVIYSYDSCMMAFLSCQLDYIWNKLQSRHGGHTCDLGHWGNKITWPFIQVLRLEDIGFWPGSWSEKTQLFNPYLETGKQTFNQGNTSCWKPI